MPKISEIDEKYSFNLVATFSEDVYRSLFMTISSGKLLSELLSLLLILRKCCQMALVSLDCVTESEICLRFAFLINYDIFIYSDHDCLCLQASLSKIIDSQTVWIQIRPKVLSALIFQILSEKACADTGKFCQMGSNSSLKTFF